MEGSRLSPCSVDIARGCLASGVLCLETPCLGHALTEAPGRSRFECDWSEKSRNEWKGQEFVFFLISRFYALNTPFSHA